MSFLMLQLCLGAVMIIATVITHAVVLDRISKALEYLGPVAFRKFRRGWKISLLTFAVLACFCSHILHIWLWAFFYLGIDALHDLETALYYSTSVFTTVGFGDIVLDHDWRLVSTFEGANGLLLFGWSTAFIFEVMSKLYKDEPIRKTERFHEKL